MADMNGKLVVLTGGSLGLGRAVAQAFSDAGARLILVGRNAAKLDKAVAELGPDRHLSLTGDVADSAVAQQAFELAKAHGGADYLINNAGIFPQSLLADTTDEEAASVMQVNFFGTFYFCRAFVPAMIEKGGGSVVNIGSIAGREPTPGVAIYSASKGAVEAFTRSIAIEAGPHVRINCVAPGPVMTEGIAEMFADDDTGALAQVSNGVPLGRIGEAHEIAEAVLYMANATWVTGQTLHVNGGRLMA